MTVSKLVLAREFGLGAGMTLFLCLAPQSSAFWTGALFVGMFTIYETFPDFHWVPAWTAFKMLNKEEDLVQGGARILVQFVAAILAGIVGYWLLDNSTMVAYPQFAHEDEWRSLLWVAFVWAAWLGLTNHDGGKGHDGFRRNFALTATFVSANYLLQGVGSGAILNTAVNIGRTFGAKIHFDNNDGPEVDLEKIWLTICGPALGCVLGHIALKIDAAIVAWDAPDAGADKTSAAYGSTDLAQVEAAPAKADENA